ncbi:unnamed protein product, partial [Sphacelaria rigidula]
GESLVIVGKVEVSSGSGGGGGGGDGSGGPRQVGERLDREETDVAERPREPVTVSPSPAPKTDTLDSTTTWWPGMPTREELRRLVVGSEVEERRTLAALRDLEACLVEGGVAAAEESVAVPATAADPEVILDLAKMAFFPGGGRGSDPFCLASVEPVSSVSSDAAAVSSVAATAQAAAAALPAGLALALGLGKSDSVEAMDAEAGSAGSAGDLSTTATAAVAAHPKQPGKRKILVRQALASAEWRVARRDHLLDLERAEREDAAKIADDRVLSSSPVVTAATADPETKLCFSDKHLDSEAVVVSAAAESGWKEKGPGIPRGLRTWVGGDATALGDLLRARINAKPAVPKSGPAEAVARLRPLMLHAIRRRRLALRRRWEELGSEYVRQHNVWQEHVARWEEKMEAEEAKEEARTADITGDGAGGDVAGAGTSGLAGGSGSGGGGGGGGGGGSGAGLGMSSRAERRGHRRMSDVVRTDLEEAEVVKTLEEKHKEEERIRKGAVDVPSMLTEVERRQLPEYVDEWNSRGTTDGLPARCAGLDPELPCEPGCNCAAVAERERKRSNLWTDVEKCIFLDKFLQHPKNFMRISSFLPRKSPEDAVQFYYDSKTSIDYKGLLKEAVNRSKGYHNHWKATLSAVRSVGASISFDRSGQPHFQVPQRDDSFNTADMHPPSRGRPLSDLRREALALARKGVIVSASAASAKNEMARSLRIPLLGGGAATPSDASASGSAVAPAAAGYQLPDNAENLLDDAQLQAAASLLPSTAINLAAYRLCMRSWRTPNSTKKIVVIGSPAGGGRGGSSGFFKENDILPFRFASSRVTGVPAELAPPRSPSARIRGGSFNTSGG